MKGKDPIAVELGSRGGKARAKSLTKERLSEIGSEAIKARWAKVKKKKAGKSK